MNVWKFIYSLHIFSIYGYITNSQSDQLPVGFIAKFVRALYRYLSGMGSNHVQAWTLFFQVLLLNCFSSWVHNWYDLSFA